MPEGLNLNGGGFTRRPGVYGSTDASALDGRSLETNVIALVGDFPFLEQAVVTSINTSRVMQGMQPLDDDLALMAKILWSSSNDDAISSGPSEVQLVNASSVTQAVLTLVNSTDQIDFAARIWGYDGCNISVEGTKSGTTYTWTVAWMGHSETYTFDEVAAINFDYEGTEADSMSVAYDTTNGLRATYIKAGNAIGTYTPSDMAFDGVIGITPDTAPTASNDFTATVNGINKATGLADSETLTWLSGGGSGTDTTGKAFSSVTSIVFAEAGGPAQTPTFTIAGYAFDLPAGSPYQYATDYVDRINTFNAQTFVATSPSPKASTIPVDEMDALSSTDVVAGGPQDIMGDLWLTLLELNNSGLVTAERSTGAEDGPSYPVALQFLSGGTRTAAGSSDWDDALSALRATKPNVIWLNDSSAVQHKKLREHCAYMAAEGGGECFGWVGTTANVTKATIDSETAALNTRHLSYCFQEVDVESPIGKTERLSPTWQALTCAAMQVSSTAAEPLTAKHPNVLAIYENTAIKSTENADSLLKLGCVFFTKGPGGLQVERSITTYRTDDNPIWSEMSAVESVNLSIRDMRDNLTILVGTPAINSTAGRIKSIAVDRLNEQKRLQIIKDYDPRSISVDDLGSTFRVNYKIAAIEPVNFIQIQASVIRIAA